MVSLLIAEGADVNAQNKKLWTPLHFAATQNAVEVATSKWFILLPVQDREQSLMTLHNKVLLNAGANVHAETKYRLTPIDFARERQQKDVLKLLKKHEKCVVM